MKSLKKFLPAMMISMIPVMAATAFAKKQRGVYSESDLYREACKVRESTLMQRLSAMPEAREYLRLINELGDADSTSRLLNESFGCHVILVPSNEALRGVTVNDLNRESVSRLLAYHSIGYTILEESDFQGSPVRLKARSGYHVEVSGGEAGSYVNGSARIIGGELAAQDSTVLVIDRALSPQDVKQDSLTEVIASWPLFIYDEPSPALKSRFAPYFYPVLEDITGKPGLSYIEIAQVCGFLSWLDNPSVEKTILLPDGIGRYSEIPVIRNLFKSDRAFVCNAFKSNILKKRYTFKELFELGKTGSSDEPATVEVLNGEVVPVRSFIGWKGQEVVQIGEFVHVSNLGHKFESSTSSVMVAEGFVSLE